MADIREKVDGEKTIRISGLEAKEISLGNIRFELEGLASDCVSKAAAAVDDWRGAHAETFVEEVNPFLRRLARLVQKVGQAKAAVAAWPDLPVRDPLEEQAVESAAVEAVASPGTSSANPVELDSFAECCLAVYERLPALTAGVGLDGVTAEVTRPSFGSPIGFPTSGGSRLPLLLEAEPPVATEQVLETVPSDPAFHVDVPDVADLVSGIRETADRLGPFTAAVALAFRRRDDRLLDLVMAHPDLADELMAWWDDGEIGAESALVIVLAYFDVFDRAKTGDEDGRISLDDLLAISNSTDVRPWVREAASYLADNPELFTLIETVNDSTQPPEWDTYDEGPGTRHGDGRMSRADIELFLEFNDHLTVLDENFATFDTAARPDRGPDGFVDLDDLEALAGGEGAVAATAAWLLAHGPLYDRVARYHAGGGSETRISTDSLVTLAVDQQAYADSAPDAAAFVDRRLDNLLGRSVGDVATPEGMYALFDTALTEAGSGQRAEVMAQVIDKVADEGAIHNPGLPLAFANGVAANIDTIHSHINDDFGFGGTDGTDGFNDTHTFLRETVRHPDAAEVVAGAASDYFRDRLDSLPDDTGREFHLTETGRTLGVITQAHANATIAEARSAAEATQPTAGTLNFLVGLIPYVGELNDFAGIGGASFGDLVTQASGGDTAAAEAAARAYVLDLEQVGAVTLTTHHYNLGAIDP